MGSKCLDTPNSYITVSYNSYVGSLLAREKCLFPLMNSFPSDSLYVIGSSSNTANSLEVASSSTMVSGAPTLFVNTNLNQGRSSYSQK